MKAITLFQRVLSLYLGLALITSVRAGTTTQPNDNFADATVINGVNVTLTGSTVGATKEVNDPLDDVPLAGGKSVWWKWTAPVSKQVTISTAGSSFDTVLAVFTDVGGGNVEQSAANDDEPFDVKTSTIRHFPAQQGVTYYIAVDGVPDGEMVTPSGSVVLSLRQEHDNFVDALELDGDHLYAESDNIDTSEELFEPQPFSAGGDFGGRSIWWKWKATASASFTVATHGSGFNTTLAIFSGNALDNLVETVINDEGPFNGAGEHTSQITFEAVAETTYYIRVDGKDGVAGKVCLSLGVNAVPPDVTTVLVPNTEFRLNLGLAVGSSYRVDKTDDLNNGWTPLKHLISTNGSAVVIDGIINQPKRFYRIVTPDLPVSPP